MAEFLGVAASAVGVASFAVQLGESVTKLKDFCAQVKNAPTELQDLIEELEVMSSILTRLSHEEPEELSADRDAFQGSVNLCQKAMDRIHVVLADLQVQMEQRRHRTAIKLVLKQDMIARLIKKLDRAKADLQLAHLVFTSSRSRLQYEKHQQQLQNMMQHIQALSSVEMSADPTAIYRRRNIVSRPARQSAPLRLHLSFWLWQRAWDISVQKAIAGWTISLHSFKVLPNHHPVWDMCYFGDLEGIRKLLERREVSVHDQNAAGTTMFMRAACYGETKLARYLLSKGADPHTRIKYYIDPNLYDLGDFENGMYFSASDTWLSERHQCPWHFPPYDFSLFGPHAAFLLDECGEAEMYEALEILSTPLSQWDDHARVSIFWHLFDYLSKSGNVEDIFGDRPLDFERVYGSIHLLIKVWGAGHTTPYVLSNWSIMMQQVVKSGADLNAKNEEDCTPFMIFLSRWCEPEMTAAVECWTNSLAQAGVDLVSYGRKELKAWRTRSTRLSKCSSEPSDAILGFTYGPAPSQWKFWFRHPGDEYAGIFWDLVERQKWTIPGAWEEMTDQRLHIHRDKSWIARMTRKGMKKKELQRMKAASSYSDDRTFRRPASYLLDGETKLVRVKDGWHVKLGA